jgi:GNAT superfamily N-acetyltransferase
MISIRNMREADIPGGIRLCRAAGWNQLEQDWRFFLDMPEGDAFVAVDEQENIVGTVASMRYQDKFGWVAMMLVDPERRRQGIAMLLMQHVLNELKDLRSIKLDATPAGREVYVRLGFKDEYVLTRWICDQSHTEEERQPGIASMTADDLENVLRIDNKVFGADRRELIQYFVNDEPRFAHVLIKDGQLVGYCLGRKGFNYYSVGPVIAPGADDAQKLISAAMAQARDKLLIIDVPQQHQVLGQWLQQVGFKQQRDLIRMYLGSNESPGLPEMQFSILGPAFG